MSRSTQLPEFSKHVVTAVLVAHDGARWLERTLDGLLGQSRPVQRIIAVDTGSKDATPRLLADALGSSSVVTRGRNTGFGAAVAYALNACAGEYTVPPEVADAHLPSEIVEWLWVLHDDSEPDRDALHHLLAAADQMPSAAVIGAKLRGWYDRRQLLEVGVTIASNGRRETGLDVREQDQGQRDGVRDVLAVSSAGMLVRRDVWDQLHGFDRSISLMHDDLDFGWRANAAGHRVIVNTDAVMYHAEAATRERRAVDTSFSRPHFASRASGLYVYLVNSRARRVPLGMLRLGALAVVRAVGMLIAKLPGHAADEVLAVLAVYSRPDRLLRGRRQRRRTRRVDNTELRGLFPPRGSQLRHLVEVVAGMMGSSRAQDSMAETAGRHRAVETGPVSEEAEELETSDSLAALRGLLLRPGVLLALGLSLLSLVAFRGLIGGGRLMGGALLPAPSSAGSLWDAFLSSWHPVGLGSGAHAPPYLAVIAGLGTVLAGNAGIAVDLLFLGCIPLAGVTAYLAASRVAKAKALRVWAALAYALLPAATGAVAAGRLGTMVGIVLLPLIGIAAARAVGTRKAPGSMRATWACGLLLALATAFVPLAWVLAVLLTVVAGFTVAREWPVLRRLLIALVLPPILLLPWSLSLLRHPSSLLLEAGLPGPGLSDLRLSPVAVLLVHPSGPGMYPLWISFGLVLAALIALLRRARQDVVLVGWAVALTGFVMAIAMSRIDVQGPMMSAPAPAWPGFATAVMGAGLILAALIGAEGARSRLAASSFGWRQPISVGVTALAAVSPVLAGLWWAWQGAGDPLERRNPVVLPAYVAAEGQTADRPRTLVLRSSGDGALSYAVLRDTGARLGDGDTSPERGKHAQLDETVAGIGAGQVGDEIDQLTEYAIQYVLVARPVDPDLARTLDGVPGLTRVSTPDGAGLWRLPSSAARLRLLSADGNRAEPLRSGAIAAKATIPAGDGERVLALAEAADSRWRASLNGERLEATEINGWEQAFRVPGSDGVLRVWHDGTTRTGWVFAQGFLVLVGVVLVLPGGRRHERDEEIVHDDAHLPRPRSRRAAEADAEPVGQPVPADRPGPVPVEAQLAGVAPPGQAEPAWEPQQDWRTGAAPHWDDAPRTDPLEWPPEPADGWRQEPASQWTPEQAWRPEPGPEWRPEPASEWRPEPAPEWRPEPASEWRPEPAAEPAPDWRSDWEQDWQSQPEWRRGADWDDPDAPRPRNPYDPDDDGRRSPGTGSGS